jgi:hypothetical protein
MRRGSHVDHNSLELPLQPGEAFLGRWPGLKKPDDDKRTYRALGQAEPTIATFVAQNVRITLPNDTGGESRQPMRRSVLFLGVMVVLSCSCKPRYFLTEGQVNRQLFAHESEYADVAEAWNHQPDGQLFVYFGDGRYRWGDIFIDEDKGHYRVGKGSNDTVVVPDLQSAAERASTDAQELKKWISVAQSLKIYSIQKTYPGYVGYIQLDLWGSEYSPYGLRYAPVDNDKAYKGLIEDLRTGGNRTNDVALFQLRDRWFYFESSRF